MLRVQDIQAFINAIQIAKDPVTPQEQQAVEAGQNLLVALSAYERWLGVNAPASTPENQPVNFESVENFIYSLNRDFQARGMQATAAERNVFDAANVFLNVLRPTESPAAEAPASASEVVSEAAAPQPSGEPIDNYRLYLMELVNHHRYALALAGYHYKLDGGRPMTRTAFDRSMFDATI